MTKKKMHAHVQGTSGPGTSHFLRQLIADASLHPIIIDPGQQMHERYSSSSWSSGTWGIGQNWIISPTAPPVCQLQPELTALADRLDDMKDILTPDDRRQIRHAIEKLIQTHLNDH